MLRRSVGPAPDSIEHGEICMRLPLIDERPRRGATPSMYVRPPPRLRRRRHRTPRVGARPPLTTPRSLSPLLRRVRRRVQPPVPRIRAAPRANHALQSLERTVALRACPRLDGSSLRRPPRRLSRQHRVTVSGVVAPAPRPLLLPVRRVPLPVAKARATAFRAKRRLPARSMNIAAALPANPAIHPFSLSGRDF